MFPGKLAGAKLVGSVCFNGTNPKACRSRLLLSTLGVDLEDLLDGGFGELCWKKSPEVNFLFLLCPVDGVMDG